jgi:hypothetical protein
LELRLIRRFKMAINLSSSLAKQIQDALANTHIPSLSEFMYLATHDPYVYENYGNWGQPGWPYGTYQYYLKNENLTQDTIIDKLLQQNASQSGWTKPEDWGGALGGVWQAPNGHYYISPYASGSWPGTLDPNTGFIDLGTNGSAVVSQGVANRNAAYHGGDWVSDMLGAIGPALMMGGVGALAAGPAIAALSEAAAPTAAAAAPLAEAAVAPQIAAELSALQASTTGLGSGIGSTSIVDQLISNLPSVSTMAQNAGINAVTQLATTGNIDPSKVLTSTLTGAVGTTVGATVGQDVLSATDSALAASIASGATKGAVQAALTGGDVFNTALASGAASGLGSITKDAGVPVPQPVINAVVNSVASGAPLDQTLTNAAITIGAGMAKDAVLGTQPPAPVETGVPSTPEQVGALPAPIQLAAADTGTTTDTQNTEKFERATDFYNSELNKIEADGKDITKQKADEVLQATAAQYGIDPVQLDKWIQDTGATGTYGMIPQESTPQTPSIVTDAVPIGGSQQPSGALPSSTQPSAPVDQSAVIETPAATTPSATPSAGQLLSTDQSAGALPTAQQMPEVLVEAQQPAETELPAVSLPNVDTTGMAITGGSTGTSTPVSAPVTTTVPVSVSQTAAPSSNLSISGLSLLSGDQQSGALPKGLNATYLQAAPLQETNFKLAKLKQLYPQLASVDPKLLSILSSKSGSRQDSQSEGAYTDLSGGTLSAPSAGYPSRAAGAGSEGITSFANTADLMAGGYNALTSAGLRSLGSQSPYGLKTGGSVKPHIPEFITGKTGHYVEGKGDGQSDDIPAMLADGEYVFDAESVAQLGNGSSKAGAKLLDHFRESLREHKRSAPTDKIPPASSPLTYMREALKRNKG